MSSLIDYCGGWKSFPIDFPFLNSAVNILDIVATESYATIKHVVPASLTWVWRKYMTHEIKTIPIQVTLEKVSKIAYLNIHGKGEIKKGDESHPVLLAHGDYSHPIACCI